MIKEHTTEDWKLIVDCPLNDSLLDESGYGNNLTGSGATFVTDPSDSSRKVSSFMSDAAALILSSPSQVTFVNNFKIEFEYYKTTYSSPYRQSPLAGADYNSTPKMSGIIVRTSSTFFDAYQFNDSTIHTAAISYPPVLNTWTTITITVENNILKIEEGGHSAQIAIDTLTTNIQNFMYIGRDYASGWYFNGYIKNFKLYVKN